MSDTPTSFNPATFLANSGMGRTLMHFRRGVSIFAQGETGANIFYLQTGKARLTIVSHLGKQATLAILSAGDFIGEECLPPGQQLFISSATALTDCTVLRIDRAEMVRVLAEEHRMSDFFVAYLLERTSRIQADLIDQLFNSTEKRLARALLNMANFGKAREPDNVIPRISQESLASLIGCTRSRVNVFMNRFRDAGFIEYNGRIKVNSSLLSVILNDPVHPVQRKTVPSLSSRATKSSRLKSRART